MDYLGRVRTAECLGNAIAAASEKDVCSKTEPILDATVLLKFRLTIPRCLYYVVCERMVGLVCGIILLVCESVLLANTTRVIRCSHMKHDKIK